MSGKRTYEPDWKGGKAPDGSPTHKGRVLDRSAREIKLAADPMCRATGRRATDAHHILLRSQGGDDVPENLLPLSDEPHRRYHSKGKLPGVRLTKEERAYLRRKLGKAGAAEYEQRKFGKEAK